MAKTDKEKRKESARNLYLKGLEQKEIAEMMGVTPATISRWAIAENWKETRAALGITRPELVNKLLVAIDKLIEQVNASNDPTAVAGLADKLAKMSAVVEKLDKKANVVDAVEVFMAFSKWLEFRAKTDPDITPELVKTINKYQDKYIIEAMTQ